MNFLNRKQNLKLSADVMELLPIGSVVLLKDGEKRLMVIGIMQSEGPKDKIYDYLGVYYPEGHIGRDLQFLFNHEDIEKVFFRGYEDVERTEFLKRLKEKI